MRAKPRRPPSAATAYIAGAALLTGCGAAPTPETSSDVRDVPALELVPCLDGDSPVAAFVASDEGVGYPGNGSDAPPGGDVWTMTADGRITALTDDATSGQPWFSDDGRLLYFTRSDVGVVGDSIAYGLEAWVWDVESGEQRMLARVDSDIPGDEIGGLQGSPDGSRAAYQGLAGEPAQPALFVIDISSGERTQLPAPPPGERFQGQTDPTWGPDGDQIAYVHYEVENELGTIWSSIRVIDLATGTESIRYAPSDPTTLHSLDWTSDGDAFIVGERLEGADATTTVISIDATTGNRTVVIPDGPFSFTLASHDGTVVSELANPQGSPDAAPTGEPWLETWRRGGVMTTAFPQHLSFAVSLTIANCARVEPA